MDVVGGYDTSLEMYHIRFLNDPTTTTQTPTTNSSTSHGEQTERDASLLATIQYVVPIFFILLIAFEVLRRKFGRFYNSKFFYARSKNRPPRTPFVWLIEAFILSENTLVDLVGLDQYLWIRFIKTCVHATLLQMLIGIVVLLPVNFTAGNNASGLSKFSIANIPDGSEGRSIFHICAVYANVALVLLLFYNMYKDILMHRIRFKNQPIPSNFTVMITGIPDSNSEVLEHMLSHKVSAVMPQPADQHSPNRMEDIHQSPVENEQFKNNNNNNNSSQNSTPIPNSSPNPITNLKEEKRFNVRHSLDFQPPSTISAPSSRRSSITSLQPDQQLQHRHFIAQLAYSHAKLEKTLKRRMKTIDSLETAEFAYKKSGKRPTTRVGKFLWLKKTDSINFYNDRLDILEERVRSLRLDPAKPGHVAFVTFQSLRANLHCLATPISSNPFHYKTTPAPPGKSIKWKNLSTSIMERRWRWLAISLVIWLLILFYMIPIGFVSSLATLKSLSRIPALGFLVDILQTNEQLSHFIQGLLPSLILTIFLALLPLILKFFIHFENNYTKLEDELAFFQKFFLFQLFNVFLGVFVASSLFGVLSQLIQFAWAPGELVLLLAESVPNSANFYASFIITQTLSRTLSLIRPFDPVIYLFKRWRAKTPRQRSKLEDFEQFELVDMMARDLLVFLITMVYSTLTPYIAPISLIYFMVAQCSGVYNCLYVYERKYEGFALHLWPALFRRAVFGVFLYEMVVMGILTLKQTPWASLMLPLMFLTILFWNFVPQLFAHMFTQGNTLDAMNRELKCPKNSATEYQNPIFLPIPAEHHLQHVEETVPTFSKSSYSSAGSDPGGLGNINNGVGNVNVVSHTTKFEFGNSMKINNNNNNNNSTTPLSRSLASTPPAHSLQMRVQSPQNETITITQQQHQQQSQQQQATDHDRLNNNGRFSPSFVIASPNEINIQRQNSKQINSDYDED